MAIEAVGLIEPLLQFCDENGVPYAGGSVTFVQVGTSTAQDVYSDAALTTTLGNVITLNAAGRFSTSSTGPDTAVYLQQKTYDYTLKNAAGATIYGPITVSGSQWPGQIQGQAILSPAANATGYTNRFTTTINKASSGTHALFAGTRFDTPTIGAGASTLTEAATVYIEGAPATGTNKYALHVDSGNAQFDGDVTVAGTLNFSAQTANTFLAGPASGSPAASAFRAMVGADLTSAGAVRTLDRKVVLTTVANTGTETAVYSFTVPANTLSTNKQIRLTLVGDYLNNTGGADIFTMRVKFGATTLLTYALNMAQDATRRVLGFQAMLSAENATNAQSVGGIAWNGGVGSTGGTMVTLGGNFFAGSNTAAEDSTLAKALAVTFQNATADALISSRLQFVILELCE